MTELLQPSSVLERVWSAYQRLGFRLFLITAARRFITAAKRFTASVKSERVLLGLPNKMKTVKAARLVNARSQSVVFVSSLLRAREIKLATALRRMGWTVILLYKQTTPFKPGKFFDVAIRASTEDELHRIAMIIRPRVCHVFSGAVDDLLLRFCRKKPGPLIADLNDVFCPSMFTYLQERFEPTKECLERADGVCARDLQPKFAERFDGMRLPPHVLWFPEYTWKDRSKHEPASRTFDPDEIHVVSVGTISLETTGWYESAMLQLANMLAEQKIHLHIYPHWFYRRTWSAAFNLEADFADFIKLQKTTQYVHVHESLSLHELSRELPRYDFGIISGGCEAFGQKLRFLKERYMHACYSGRVSDYLDAGLPILINREVSFNYWLLRRSGVAIDLADIFKPGFRERLIAIKQDRAWKQKVATAAESLSLDAQAPRLARFYKRVIEAKPTSKRRFSVTMRISHKLPIIGPKLRELNETLDETQTLNRQYQAQIQRLLAEVRIGEMGIHEIAGLLNWPGIQDDHERNNGFSELLSEIQLNNMSATRGPTAGAATADGRSRQNGVSSAWGILNRKNLDQLLTDGYNNFKRTIALNYFTFPVQAGDPQIIALEAKLDSNSVETCWRLAQNLPDDPTLRITDQLHYRYFVFLLWMYARQIDRFNVLSRLSEPREGNPIIFPFEGHQASQDLANSLIEYYSMREGLSFDSINKVLEIGGGYGRDAQVVLEAHPHIQYTLIDIPPALYVAQRYLSSVFRDRSIFHVRDFRTYHDVRSEIEGASIVFLLPHQLAKMPDGYFDLTVNISSFGEMSRQQIDDYFAEIARTTSGWLYVKQWKESKNPFDGLVITEADYPWREHWKKLYSRTCAVQSQFFEALYEIGGQG